MAELTFDDLIPKAGSDASGGGALSFDDLIPKGDAPATGMRGDIRDPLLQGLTFGLYDEMAGAVSGAGAAMTGGSFNEAYNERTGALREDYGAYKERQPWVSMGAEVAGALPTALIPGLNVARSANLGQAVWRGANAGALGGALYGYGQGEDGAASRLGNAASGAVAGAVIGGALPGVGSGAGRVTRALLDRVSPNAATKAGVNRAAQREINSLHLAVIVGGKRRPASVALSRRCSASARPRPNWWMPSRLARPGMLNGPMVRLVMLCRTRTTSRSILRFSRRWMLSGRQCNGRATPTRTCRTRPMSS